LALITVAGTVKALDVGAPTLVAIAMGAVAVCASSIHEHRPGRVQDDGRAFQAVMAVSACNRRRIRHAAAVSNS
jgi:hypothetical protein